VPKLWSDVESWGTAWKDINGMNERRWLTTGQGLIVWSAVGAGLWYGMYVALPGLWVWAWLTLAVCLGLILWTTR
jgi:hypothetical protein